MMIRSLLLGALVSLSSSAFAEGQDRFCQTQPDPAYAAARSIILREIQPQGANCQEKARKLAQMVAIRLTGVGIEDVRPFEVFEAVEEIDLSNNSIRDIRPLLRLPALKSLDLSENKISTLRIVQKNDKLEVLNLDNPKTRMLRLTGLQHLSDLRKLSLQKIGLTRISDLGQLPSSLGVLNLLWNDLTDAKELEESLQERVVGFSPNGKICGEAESLSLPTLSRICKT